MAIKVGNKEVTNITVGSTPVKSVYKGSTKIWPSESWKTVWSSETIYKLKVIQTNETSTEDSKSYLERKYHKDNLTRKQRNAIPAF